MSDITKGFYVLLFLFITATAHGQVGILAGENGCPPGSTTVFINIDNEDKKNANARSGWLGSSASDKNTRLLFCQVPQWQFDHVLFQQPYMLLYLGRCPEGYSKTVARLIDCENQRPGCNAAIDGEYFTANIPKYLRSGSQYPNIGLDALGYWGVTLRDWYNKDIALEFCHMPGGTPTGKSFPDLGVPYGVLAASDFAPASATGRVYMDDEDADGFNRWRESTESLYSPLNQSRTYPGVAGDKNTEFRFARVFPYP